MGSDYQRVKILELRGGTVVLQVTERHPDMDAIHTLLTKAGQEYTPAALAAPLTSTVIPRGKTSLARNFAAQLLSDYGESPFYSAVEAASEDSEPNPAQFIGRVAFQTIKKVGKASNESWLYRATLEITLKRPTLAAFKPRKTYDARACPTGDWELSF